MQAQIVSPKGTFAVKPQMFSARQENQPGKVSSVSAYDQFGGANPFSIAAVPGQARGIRDSYGQGDMRMSQDGSQYEDFVNTKHKPAFARKPAMNSTAKPAKQEARKLGASYDSDKFAALMRNNEGQRFSTLNNEEEGVNYGDGALLTRGQHQKAISQPPSQTPSSKPPVKPNFARIANAGIAGANTSGQNKTFFYKGEAQQTPGTTSRADSFANTSKLGGEQVESRGETPKVPSRLKLKPPPMVKKMADTMNISDADVVERRPSPSKRPNSGVRKSSAKRSSRQGSQKRQQESEQRPSSTIEGLVDTNKEFQVQHHDLMNTIDDENAGSGVITKSKRTKKQRPIIKSPDDAQIIRSPEEANTPALSKRLDSENLLAPRDSIEPKMKPDLDSLDFRDVERLQIKVNDPNSHKLPLRLPITTFPETPSFKSDKKDAVTEQIDPFALKHSQYKQILSSQAASSKADIPEEATITQKNEKSATLSRKQSSKRLDSAKSTTSKSSRRKKSQAMVKNNMGNARVQQAGKLALDNLGDEFEEQILGAPTEQQAEPDSPEKANQELVLKSDREKQIAETASMVGSINQLEQEISRQNSQHEQKKQISPEKSDEMRTSVVMGEPDTQTDLVTDHDMINASKNVMMKFKPNQLQVRNQMRSVSAARNNFPQYPQTDVQTDPNESSSDMGMTALAGFSRQGNQFPVGGYDSSSTAHNLNIKPRGKKPKQEADPDPDEEPIILKRRTRKGYMENIFVDNDIHPYSNQLAILDSIRFTSVFIFLGSVMLMNAYVTVSKFAALENRQMFIYFLWARPIFIVFYCFFNQMLAGIKSGTSDKEIEKRREGINEMEMARLDSQAAEDAIQYVPQDNRPKRWVDTGPDKCCDFMRKDHPYRCKCACLLQGKENAKKSKKNKKQVNNEQVLTECQKFWGKIVCCCLIEGEQGDKYRQEAFKSMQRKKEGCSKLCMCKELDEEWSDDEETPKKCCSIQPRVVRCFKRCKCIKCEKRKPKFLPEEEEEKSNQLEEDNADAPANKEVSPAVKDIIEEIEKEKEPKKKSTWKEDCAECWCTRFFKSFLCCKKDPETNKCVCKAPHCFKVIGACCRQCCATGELPLKTEEEILDSDWGSEEGEDEEEEDSASYYDSEWESEYDEEQSESRSRAPSYKKTNKVPQVHRKLAAPNQVSSLQRVVPAQQVQYQGALAPRQAPAQQGRPPQYQAPKSQLSLDQQRAIARKTNYQNPGEFTNKFSQQRAQYAEQDKQTNSFSGTKHFSENEGGEPDDFMEGGHTREEQKVPSPQKSNFRRNSAFMEQQERLSSNYQYSDEEDDYDMKYEKTLINRGYDDEEEEKVPQKYKPSIGEEILITIFSPIVMYSGMSRMHNKFLSRERMIYITYGQEVFLHTVPLTVIVIYNNYMLNKSFGLDKAIIVLSILHVFFVAIDFLYFRFQLNMNHNLERRMKQGTCDRVKDYGRLACIAITLTLVFSLCGFYSFAQQQCQSRQFVRDYYQCFDCTDYLGDKCLKCDADDNCLRCIETYYPRQGKCAHCSQYSPGCLRCTPRGCIECDMDFYMINGRCSKCTKMVGCMAGYCGAGGCSRCEKGYFLSKKGDCIDCNGKMPGCSECDSEKECTACNSDFLDPITDSLQIARYGKAGCRCNGKSKNMLVDAKGSCTCKKGYYLTAKGCHTCTELIPNCQMCYLAMSNSGLPIYNEADVSGRHKRKYFVECGRCEQKAYKKRPDLAKKEQTTCPLCDTVWPGCGSCGAYATRCSRCLQTHIYQIPYNHQTPCRPCYFYISGCAWCRSRTDCVEYNDRRLTQADFTPDKVALPYSPALPGQ